MKPAKAIPVIRDLSGVSCVGYCRVSTDAQAAEDKTSLDDQRRAIEARAAKLNHAVTEWFVDDGFSGATVEKRPAFRALIASCERHPRARSSPGFILILNDSRFGRFDDPDEATAIRFGLKQQGWHVRFAEGDEVEDTVARGVLRFIGSAQASEYRANLQRNARRGIKGSTERGYWCRPEPFGYRRKVIYPAGRERVLDPQQRKSKDERVGLWPDELEATIVRRLYEEYAGGAYSLKSLAVWVAGEYPAFEWSRRTVQRILQNVVYLGHVASGPNTAKRGESYGLENAHPAVVTPELFARVQERMAANARALMSPASDYVLSGLVACSYCGRPYHGGGFGSKRADGSRSQFYRCGSTSYDRITSDCPGPVGTISKHFLEGAVLGTIATVLRSPTTQRYLEAAVDRFLENSASGVGTETENGRKDLLRLEKRRQNLLDAIEDGTTERTEVAPTLVTLRSQIDAAKERLQRLAFRTRQSGASREERSKLLELASNFGEAVKQLHGSELRELVRPWLASAQFDKTSRELTVAIRRVPVVGPLLLAPQADR